METTTAESTDYQPTEKELAEQEIALLMNDIGNLIDKIGKNPIFYIKFEHQIFELREKVSDTWGLLRIYQKNQQQKEGK